ncbi:unnamed protein product [Diatraea saccharalis]|uniref:Uncharacterized protein n=1 Tax=Diatraea saccharalis TaxID=40085 RepID=A0A9N9N121_9NEOP|nr:unnamed protein product [Diatraea saccharalis]
MLLKFVLILTAVVMVSANPVLTRSPYEGKYNTTVVSVIALEEPCVRQGGMCLRVEDCDPTNVVRMQAVLCPKQRHLGVECCYVSFKHITVKT